MLDGTASLTYKRAPMPRAATTAYLSSGPRSAPVSVEPGHPRLRLLPKEPRSAKGSDDAAPPRLIGRSDRPLRVLIVDDDPGVALVLEDMITEAGGESVGIISSALAAIGAAAVIAPDVVLMDVRLPGAMDGIEAAGIIRARRSAAIVIITGAAADPEIRSRLRSLEGVELVVKPVLENELCAAILRAYAAR
jgi:CheY-like chemotaxis protein